MAKKTQIIIIPGILGSALKYENLKIWPPYYGMIGEGFNVIVKKLEDIDDRSIKATGWHEDYYSDLQEYCNTIDTDEIEVTPFAYDWRQNNFQHFNRLSQTINRDAENVIIIAHSMGGIVSKLFLNTYEGQPITKNIKKLITLGTPWNGSPQAYLNIMYGMGISFVRGAFKTAISGFPSVYQLFPNKNYIEKNKNGFIEGVKWNDLYYKEYAKIIRKNNLDINDILINFYNVMSKELPNNIEHHEIIGYSKATVTSIFDNNFKIFGRQGKGDGTVPLHSAVSNTEYKYFVDDYHKLLPKNKTVHKIINDVVNNKSYNDIMRNNRIMNYEEVQNNKINFKVIRVACPVTVSLTDNEGNIIYGDIGEIKYNNWSEFILNEQEGVQYIGNDVYFILNNDETSKIHVEAYEQGAVSISVEEYEDGILNKTAKFKTFNMDEGINAELTIGTNLKACTVELNGRKSGNVDSVIIDDIINEDNEDKEIKLPITKYKFVGNNVKSIDDNNIIGSEEIKLFITSVIDGTHEVFGTFYTLNDENPVAIDINEEIILNINEGNNVLKVYSVDIYNNVELNNEKNIYYVENRMPIIKIKATPDAYTLNLEFPEYKGLEKLSLPTPTFDFIINNNNGVTFNYIEYKNIKREIVVRINDAMGTIDSNKIILDEVILQLILDSKANVNDYQKFLELIGIEDVKSYKIIKDGNTNRLRTLNYNKLTDADALEFKCNNIIINIDKSREHEIKFSNLVEYIELAKDETCNFEFSIFESNNKKRITNLPISISLAIESDDTQYMEELCELEYNVTDERYVLSLKSSEVRMLLIKSEIIKEKVEKLYLLIKSNQEEKKVLRTHEISLK